VVCIRSVNAIGLIYKHAESGNLVLWSNNTVKGN